MSKIQERKRECHSRGPKGEQCLHDHASHHQEVGKDGKVVRMDCLCRGCECRGFVSVEEAESAAKFKSLADQMSGFFTGIWARIA
jgi:hypothetical protein